MKLFGHCACAITMLLFSTVWAKDWQTDGNLKYRFLNTNYPNSSIFQEFVGSDATDHSLSGRFNLKVEASQWSASASYQLTGFYADSLENSGELGANPLFRSSIQNDDARLLDLTHTFDDDGKRALLGRLDRFSFGYQNDSNVVKIGRQAVSWGNGLIYSPMDFFNPFDPAAIDTEYKAGDDMLYAQHLFNSGNDLQLVWVSRRDENQNTTSDVNSIAIKYHGFIGSSEFDLLLSEHFQDTIIGIGSAFSIGGSVVRGDWVLTDAEEGRFNSVVANISYSWTSWDKNVTASLEYFHNDFGIRSGELKLSELTARTQLLNRVARGELFTLGRDYLAGSALIEIAPLWLITSNVFFNLNDKSTLAQLISQHDLTQNTQLVVAVSVPIGPKGTEFGGFLVSSSETDKFSDNDWSLYAQLAWYF